MQFAPTAASGHTGTLRVGSRKTEVSVSLSGTGFVPAPPGNLYWTDVAGGTVHMSKLDGSEATQIATGQPGPEGVAVHEEHLYWGNSGSGTIVRADRDGSNPATIVSGQSPRQIAIDSANGHLYWANFGSGMFGTGASVWMANLDGSEAHSIASFTGGQGVAVNGTDLYWTQGFDSDNPSQPRGIMRAGLDGSGAQAVVPDVQVRQLAANGTHLYWTGPDSSGDNFGVHRANLDGSGAQLIAAENDLVARIALTATNLYWGDLNAGTVTRAHLDGSNPTTLVNNPDQFVWGVAVG